MKQLKRGKGTARFGSVDKCVCVCGSEWSCIFLNLLIIRRVLCCATNWVGKQERAEKKQPDDNRLVDGLVKPVAGFDGSDRWKIRVVGEAMARGVARQSVIFGFTHLIWERIAEYRGGEGAGFDILSACDQGRGLFEQEAAGCEGVA